MNEQIIILMAGIASGGISAIIATLPSLRANQDIPWLYLMTMIISITITGLAAILLSVRSVSGESLIMALKKE
jgi:ABC-type antimicrobial peptide transport system permease subunit